MSGPTPPKDRRERGRSAEEAALRYLEERGWRVLERNHHSRFGEIDLIVEQGDTIAFVEVRSRKSLAFGHPLEMITETKRRRIVRTALSWAQRTRVLNSHFLRFDVVAVVGDETPTIEHLEAAFDGEGVVF